jgi:hypothetical protein
MKNSMSDQHNDKDEQGKEIVTTARKDQDIKSSQKNILVSTEPETTEMDAEEGLPEKWKDIPFEELQLEGWRPRIKNKQGKQYLTIRRAWRDGHQRTKSLERSLGLFSEKNYRLLQKLLQNPVEFEESDEEEDDNKLSSSENSGVPESDVPESDIPESQNPRIKIEDLEPRRPGQPPAYLVKGTKILQSGVGRHISIPDKFYYDTDMLEFFEYFHDRGYRGSIVDFMHDCVRNYLIEKHYKVGVIIERQIEREM